MAPKSNSIWTAIIVSALTTFILYYALFSLFSQGVTSYGKPFNWAITHFKEHVLVITLLLSVIFLLRAWRYKILIEPIAIKGLKVRHSSYFSITAIRAALVDILPMRLGEVCFCVLLAQNHSINYRASITAVIFSTVFDFFTLLFLCLLFLAFSASEGGSFLGYLVVILVIVFAVCIFFQALQSKALYNALKLLKPNQPFLVKFHRLLLKLITTIEKVSRISHLSKVLLLSILLRLLRVFTLLVVFISSLSYFLSNADSFSIMRQIFALLSSEFASALPIPNVAGLGVWELGGVVTVTDNPEIQEAMLFSLVATSLMLKMVGYLLSAIIGTLYYLQNAFIKKLN